MKVADLMAKATQAAVSARMLLDAGDADGACNRAYYAEMGRLLKQAETRRYVADYEGDPVELDDARDMVLQAEAFVAALRVEFMPNERPPL